MVLSSLPLARLLPSGLKATERTLPCSECPVRVRSSAPVETSHSFIVLSIPPLARVFPSGLKATALIKVDCHVRVRNTTPVESSHNFIVMSQLPLARIFPSGLKTTVVMNFECPVRVRNSAPVETSHNFISPSQPPLARVFPSGLKATDAAEISVCTAGSGGSALVDLIAANSRSTVESANSVVAVGTSRNDFRPEKYNLVMPSTLSTTLCASTREDKQIGKTRV